VGDSVLDSIYLVFIDHCGAKRISIYWAFNHCKHLALDQTAHFFVERLPPKFSIRSRHCVRIASRVYILRSVCEVYRISIEERVRVENIHLLKKQNLIQDICLLLSPFVILSVKKGGLKH
jgi:hypothetical protein